MQFAALQDVHLKNLHNPLSANFLTIVSEQISGIWNPNQQMLNGILKKSVEVMSMISHLVNIQGSKFLSMYSFLFYNVGNWCMVTSSALRIIHWCWELTHLVLLHRYFRSVFNYPWFPCNSDLSSNGFCMLNKSFKFTNLCRNTQTVNSNNNNNNQALVPKFIPYIQSKQRIKITEDDWDKK